MNPRLPSLSSSRLVRTLEKHGFEQVRQSGSHVILRNVEGRRVTVPLHKGKDLGRGILSKIMKDAGLTADDL